MTITPSPPDFTLLTQRAQNQFSWIEVTKSTNHNFLSQITSHSNDNPFDINKNKFSMRITHIGSAQQRRIHSADYPS